MKINKLTFNLQKASTKKKIPHRSTLRRWLLAALHFAQNKKKFQPVEITLRIVDETESASLNEMYRHKKGSTNVLSFPAEIGIHQKQHIESNKLKAVQFLGDIVICAPLVLKEARIQRKKHLAHWAHLVIHATLHLLGYDHIEPKETRQMETLEKKILLYLGYPDPYGEDNTNE